MTLSTIRRCAHASARPTYKAAATFALFAWALSACAQAVTGDPTDAEPDVATTDGDTSTSDVADDATAVEDAAEDTTVDADTQTDVAAPDTATDADTDPLCDGLGCVCDVDDDCASGYCLRTDTGKQCSERCEQVCSLEGWTCELFENAGGDLVRLCVPEAGSYCRPCERDLDCLGLDDLCLPLRDGSFCASACRGGDLCPPGASCERRSIGGDLFDVCIPLDEACTPCFDEERPLNTPCGTCGSGLWSCGDAGLTCVGDAGDAALNACGQCGALPDGLAPGDPCGTCSSGVLACDETGALTCRGDAGDDAFNRCGGCDALADVPGNACGTCDSGAFECVTPNQVACVGNAGEGAFNGCGGCGVLAAEPDSPCGVCLDGANVCSGTDAVVCAGASSGNACGGCGPLGGVVGAACGECGDGALSCSGGALVCSGAGSPGTWYPDVDLDGFGDAAATPVTACEAPPEHVANNDDCDDGARAVFPRGPTWCDAATVLRCPATGGVAVEVDVCPFGCFEGACALDECEGRSDGAFPDICTAAADCCNGLCLGNPTFGFGICTQSCAGYADCNPPTVAGEYYCYEAPGTPSLCAVSNWGSACDAALDCPGEACLISNTASTCTWQCDRSADCPTGSMCGLVPFAGGIELDVCTPIGTQCIGPNDCLSGTCLTDDVTGIGYCTAFCGTDRFGCPAGFGCEIIDIAYPPVCVAL